jgi:hypothetical protein
VHTDIYTYTEHPELIVSHSKHVTRLRYSKNSSLTPKELIDDVLLLPEPLDELRGQNGDGSTGA